ncbi:hypothetical protein [Shewanella sp. UCD-KL12]|uniref:hypothetical protein n=1 Tax=Shewanella sp. UCD-KL12 TaxID=1917163 RepID=UPI0009705E30|nr:hypothetical protein [Shewanella sp. UCD-KL12]
MFTLKNILLTLALATSFGLLVITVIDPLFGACHRFEAKVITSDAQSSTITLPNGRVTVLDKGNLTPNSEIKVAAKSRLVSGVEEYKFKSVISEAKPSSDYYSDKSSQKEAMVISGEAAVNSTE